MKGLLGSLALLLNSTLVFCFGEITFVHELTLGKRQILQGQD